MSEENVEIVRAAYRAFNDADEQALLPSDEVYTVVSVVARCFITPATARCAVSAR